MSIKISRLEIKNFLGIEELDLNLGSVNKITGGNGKGKTSILDSIQKAIYNADSPRPKIIRNGEESAQLFVQLDNGISIERTINAEGTDKVKVIDNGDVVKKPEAFLKKLLGQYRFGFNPISFIQKSDKEQAEILLSLLPIKVTETDIRDWLKDELYPDGYLPIGINYNQHGLQVCKDLASKNTGVLYDKRALANKEVALYKDEIVSLENTMPDNYSVEKWQNLSLKDIQAKINEANKTNNFIVEAKNLIENADIRVENIKNTYEIKRAEMLSVLDAKVNSIETEYKNKQCQLSEEIEALQKKIDELKNQKNSLHAQLEIEIKHLLDISNKENEDSKTQESKEINEIMSRVEKAKKYLEETNAIDIEPLNAEFDEVEKMRSYIPLAEKIEVLKETLDQKKKEAECLDKFVEIARSKPKELLEKVKLPIPNLGFSEEGNLTINGLPIKNLSTSEQLKVALDIARVTAGDLNIICVDKLESLDQDVQNQFYEQIDGDGYQYIVTSVTNGDMKVEVK